MRRAILGVVAFALTIIGGALYFGFFGDSEQMGGVFFKAGLGLTAIWLAIPQLDELFSSPKGMSLLAIVLGCGILLFYPRAAFIVLPIVGVLAAIQFVRWLFTPYPDDPPKKKKATGKRTAAGNKKTTGNKKM